jgi:hypothetical protein
MDTFFGKKIKFRTTLWKCITLLKEFKMPQRKGLVSGTCYVFGGQRRLEGFRVSFEKMKKMSLKRPLK